MRDNQTLRVVVFAGEGCYVAQCLEYDVCTQAPDIETLKERMDCLLAIELSEAEHSLDAAPEEFHKMWDDVSPISNGNHAYGLLEAA